MHVSIKINQFSVFVPRHDAWNDLQTTLSAGSDEKWYRMIHEWVVKSKCGCFELLSRVYPAAKMLEAGGTKSFHEDWCAIDFWLQLFNFWRGKLSASLLFHPLFLTLDLLNPCLTGAITARPIIDISSWGWETCLHRPHQTKLKNIWKHVGQFIAGKVESKNCWPGHTKHTLWRRLPQTLHTPTLRPNAGPAMAQVQIGRLRVPLQV